MSNIERAIFYEGQILSASDMTTTVEAGRNQLARHERYLHLWGIAHGLKLTGQDKTDTTGKKYQEITLSAGVAIDGRGREVVVAEDEVLSEDLFDESNVALAKADALYPVFLIGRDETASKSALPARSCDSSQPTRKLESFEIIFGRPGEELDLNNQGEPKVSDSLDDLAGEAPWRILLGFVKWGEDETDPAKKVRRFTKAESTSKEGIGPRYAGVRADEVAARSGTLTLRTRTDSAAGKPALVLDEENGGEIRFGLQNSAGSVTEVFSVDAAGNVSARGKISGALVAGVQIESGIASDGLLLPLPKGITDEQVNNGQVILHIEVTPLYSGGLFLGNTIPHPIECRVEGRRVFCRVQWTGGTAVESVGVCNYTVLAFVPPVTRSGP